MTHKLGIFNSIPNESYHEDDGFYSSSRLKLMLEDPTMYYRKYILKNLPQEKKDFFDVGNAYHTKLLEPDLFKDEYAFYEGKTKRGKDWEAFKAKNEGKIILGNKQKLEFDTLVEATLESKYAKEILEGGKPELSIYVKLNGFNVKVRFDKLNKEKGYGLDLKSTTGSLIGKKGYYACQKKIAGLDYDLSAALYLDAVNAIYAAVAKKQGKEHKPIEDFYWIFASKDYKGSRTFRASKQMIENGRRKYLAAMEEIKKYDAAGWRPEEFEDKIEDIEPLDSDRLDSSEEVETWT